MKTIYLTVDTECHNYEKVNQYIFGKTKCGTYGLEKILQLGQELEVPVNVFLDIPECHAYGDEYIRSVIELVQRYRMPLFLHVHPDYIGDPQRKHLWEYTRDEQKAILKQAVSDYRRLCGEHTNLVFRAGAWGVNSDTYEVLSELGEEEGFSGITDLSYVYNRGRRCHLTQQEYGAVNASRSYKGVTVLPNTTYIGFDYFGKKFALELSVASPNVGEFRQVIDGNKLHSITYTMHSWDFLKKWFFRPDALAGDRRQVRRFRKCVAYARKQGYEFGDLNDFRPTEEEDQCLNLCTGIIGKIRCLWYNYHQFALNGRSYKKYAFLYFSPVILGALLLAVLGMILL